MDNEINEQEALNEIVCELFKYGQKVSKDRGFDSVRDEDFNDPWIKRALQIPAEVILMREHSLRARIDELTRTGRELCKQNGSLLMKIEAMNKRIKDATCLLRPDETYFRSGSRVLEAIDILNGRDIWFTPSKPA